MDEKVFKKKEKYINDVNDYKATQTNALKLSETFYPKSKHLHYNICDKNTQKHDLKTLDNSHNYFSCFFCGYKTIYRKDLKKHNIIHTGEKPFHCNLCDYKVAQRSNLIRHEKQHSGEKPFKCSFCDFKGAYKYVIKAHERTHTREKPFECNFCEYRANYKNDVKKHEINHMGKKPFHCRFCNYKAARKSCIIRHVKIHFEGKKRLHFNLYYCKVIQKGTEDKCHIIPEFFKCSLCDYKNAEKNVMVNHEMNHFTGTVTLDFLIQFI